MTTLIIFLFILFITVILLVFGVVNLATLFRAAPFVTTPRNIVDTMVRLANVKTGEKACDVGSGEGRIVMALAKAGAEAHGYEINPLLVLWSKLNIRRAGLSRKAFIHWKSFWKQNFSQFDVVTVYGITHMMKKFGDKLSKELKSGSRVVSHGFQIPNLTLANSVNSQHGKVHLYIASPDIPFG